MKNSKFLVWKVIQIGTHQNVNELCKNLSLEDLEKQIINSPDFVLSSVKQEIQLVKVSLKELGLKGMTTYANICVRAKQHGLRLCPSETYPQLETQHWLKGSDNYGLYIGMRPITDHQKNISRIFVTAGGGEPDDPDVTTVRSGGYEATWSDFFKFIFCLPETPLKKWKEVKFIGIDPGTEGSRNVDDILRINDKFITLPPKKLRIYFSPETEIVIFNSKNPSRYNEVKKIGDKEGHEIIRE